MKMQSLLIRFIKIFLLINIVSLPYLYGQFPFSENNHYLTQQSPEELYKRSEDLGSRDSGNSWNTTLIGRWANGHCYASDVAGKISYFGKAITLLFGRGVVVSGNYVYVADYRDGLMVVDASDPTLHQELGFFDPGGLKEVAVCGYYTYVADEYRKRAKQSGAITYIVKQDAAAQLDAALNSIFRQRGLIL